MDRRKFLIGAGGTAIGASAIIGSGAFGFVRAERDISVAVVDDEHAFLGLEATSPYASKSSDGGLELNFDENADAGDGHPEGTGLNDRADTRFDNVFSITNQGTNDARLSFHDTEGEVGYDSPAATWYYTKGEEGAAPGDGDINEDNPVLSPGDELYVHVIFWLTEFDEGDIPDHLGIVAEEP